MSAVRPFDFISPRNRLGRLETDATGHKRFFLFLALFLFFCLPSSASARFYNAFLIVEARSPLDTHTRTIAGYARRALANASKVPLCFAAFPVWKGYPISLVARRCGSDKELIRSLRHAFQEL